MSGSGVTLSGLTRQLIVQWEQTRETWSDDKAREFEQKYIVELASGIEKAVAVLEQLDKLGAKIRKDCE